MEFRIVGLTDEKNVIVIAEKPISLINYNMIDEWLNNYYYNHLSDTTKNSDYINVMPNQKLFVKE